MSYVFISPFQIIVSTGQVVEGELSPPSPQSSYLMLDGVDDYMKTPTMTFTEVVMDFKAYPVDGVYQYYMDSRSGIAQSYLTRTTAGVNEVGGNYQAFYVNGSPITWADGTKFVPENQRILFRAVLGVTGTDDVNLFSSLDSAQVMKADVYDIKFYNGTALVAHYDMSTGTVLDQSGNGNHASLSGGTWVIAPPVTDAPHLSFDGIDDYMLTPGLTYDSIEMDVVSKRTGTVATYFFDDRQSLSTSSSAWISDNGTAATIGSVATLYVNGIPSTSTIPTNVKTTLKLVRNAAVTRAKLTFFAMFNVTRNMAADVYDIKIYNGTALVAHYDMSTGTVLDQSGNGNHASLGGNPTWFYGNFSGIRVRDGELDTQAHAFATFEAGRILDGNLQMTGACFVSFDSTGMNLFQAESSFSAKLFLGPDGNRIASSENPPLSSAGFFSADGTRWRMSESQFSGDAGFSAFGDALFGGAIIFMGASGMDSAGNAIYNDEVFFIGAVYLSSQALVYSWDTYKAPSDLEWTEDSATSGNWHDSQLPKPTNWKGRNL